jgi:CHASE3 domain sensor protein
MRLRIPPLLPPYAVLVLVIVYAVGALWIGSGRLDGITKLTEAAASNAETANNLNALVAAVNDMETAGRGFVITGDESFLEQFEGGRRRAPVLLSSLRDKMRDDTTELSLIEELVSLLAERSTIIAAGIERRRIAPDQPPDVTLRRRARETTEGIRNIVATLESREQDELRQIRQALARTLDAARRGLYIMAGVTLLLVVSLFFAVRRLRTFISVAPDVTGRGEIEIARENGLHTEDAGVGTLLRDALLRVRLAAASEAAGSGVREHLRALIATMEQAVAAHMGAYERDPTQAEARTVVQAVALLGRVYSIPGRLAVKATIDQTVKVTDGQKAFLIVRSAEWALEAIMLRKRTGNVTLSLTNSGGGVSLRIVALTDDPKSPVTLTPRETEEANALRQGAAAVGGSFALDDGPTGLSLVVTIPVGT